jgi:hypothetical protein
VFSVLRKKAALSINNRDWHPAALARGWMHDAAAPAAWPAGQLL